MSKLLALASLLCAACELQPAPPRPSGAPTPAATPTPPAANPTPPTPAKEQGSAAPKIEITPACLAVATHVADVLIASAEPGQRAVFETERDRIVRASGEVCTTQAWSEPARACYNRANTQAALKECESKFPAQPQPQTRQPPPGDPPVVGPPNPLTPGQQGGLRPEPGAQVVPGARPPILPPARQPGAGSAAPVRPGASAATPVQPARPAAGSAAPARPGTGSGSAAPARPARPAAGAAGAGSGSAAPRPTGGSLMPPRTGR